MRDQLRRRIRAMAEAWLSTRTPSEVRPIADASDVEFLGMRKSKIASDTTTESPTESPDDV